MTNGNKVPKSRFDLKSFIERQTLFVQKKATQIWLIAKPLLAPKYWPVYLLSFCIGFALWGPIHGWQKINRWRAERARTEAKIPTVETLQRQLTQLKQELKQAQSTKKAPEFDPGSFSRPALGQVIQGFDWVQTGNAWRLHTGVDIGIPPGSNILAAAAGTAAEISKSAFGDYSVTINHGNGWTSSYANLAKVMIVQGEQLMKGVIIGYSSTTGCNPHQPSFHFALYHDQQPVDPQKIIAGL